MQRFGPEEWTSILRGNFDGYIPSYLCICILGVISQALLIEMNERGGGGGFLFFMLPFSLSFFRFSSGFLGGVLFEFLIF